MKIHSKVMIRLESGMSEEEIETQLGTSKRIIHRCKKEFDARNSIKRLISEGRFNEANEIAKGFNLRAIDKNTLFVLLELANKKGDTKKAKEIIDILKNMQLNYEERKRVLYLALEIEPDNIEYIDDLIRIAKKQEDYKQQYILSKRKEQIINNKKYARRNKLEGLKINDFEEGVVLGKLQEARALIYREEDIMKVIEEIDKLLEGEKDINKVLVQAELFTHTGFRKRAEMLLKKYKNGLDKKADTDEIKYIVQALEVTRSSKTKPYAWREFWGAREQNMEETMFSNALEEDEGER